VGSPPPLGFHLLENAIAPTFFSALVCYDVVTENVAHPPSTSFTGSWLRYRPLGSLCPSILSASGMLMAVPLEQLVALLLPLRPTWLQ
jgi:hypothetical protein